jgi:hypothetical protein
MPEMTLKGESVLQTYPAHIEELFYQDNVVIRITGIKADIDETVELYIQEFPVGAFKVEALTPQAKFLGPTIVETFDGKALVDVYELLLARKNQRVTDA